MPDWSGWFLFAVLSIHCLERVRCHWRVLIVHLRRSIRAFWMLFAISTNKVSLCCDDHKLPRLHHFDPVLEQITVNVWRADKQPFIYYNWRVLLFNTSTIFQLFAAYDNLIYLRFSLKPKIFCPWTCFKWQTVPQNVTGLVVTSTMQPNVLPWVK